MRRFRPLLVPAAFAVLVAPGAQAAKPPPPLPAEVGGVVACNAVADPAARRAGLEKAAAARKAATGWGDLVVLNREKIRYAQRENVGLAEQAEPEGTPAGPDKATFEVVSADLGGDRHWYFVLRDGGRWRVADEEFFSRQPKAGSKAEVSKGVLGRFFISVDGQPGVRAARIK
jgi:hypothetical protein